MNLTLGFDLETFQIPLEELMPSKKVPDGVMTVRSYVARHAFEILEQFELVLNTVSMEEAVEQAEREEGPSGSELAADIQPTQDGNDAASDPGMARLLG